MSSEQNHSGTEIYTCRFSKQCMSLRGCACPKPPSDPPAQASCGPTFPVCQAPTKKLDSLAPALLRGEDQPAHSGAVVQLLICVTGELQVVFPHLQQEPSQATFRGTPCAASGLLLCILICSPEPGKLGLPDPLLLCPPGQPASPTRLAQARKTGGGTGAPGASALSTAGPVGPSGPLILRKLC